MPLHTWDERSSFRRTYPCFGHWRVGATRQKRVHANIPWSELSRQTLREAYQSGLARRIGSNARHPDSVANKRGGEDQRTTAPLKHGRKLILSTQISGGQDWSESVRSTMKAIHQASDPLGRSCLRC